MKKMLLIVIMISSILNAMDVDIFGYYESQFFQMEDFQFSSNKLRLDIEKSDNNYELRANFNTIIYGGKTQYDFLDYLPAKLTEGLPPMKYSLNDTIYLDNLYAKFYFRSFDLTIGKQQISLGSGYIFNPIDIWNQKDISDPSYEQSGHNALRVDIPFLYSSTISGIYTLGEKFAKSDKFVNIKKNFGRFDLSLSYAQKHISSEKKEIWGGSTVGEIRQVGVYTETAYENDNWLITTGLDYTFESEFFILVEYLYNSNGKNGDYTLTDWMNYLEGQPIAEHQIYLINSYPIGDFMTLENSFAYSISDESLALFPNISYSLSQNIDISLQGNLTFGAENAIFNSSNSAFIRAKIYF